MRDIRVAVIGDFNRVKHSHWATEAALFHAAAALGVSVESRWVPTPAIEAHGAAELLGDAHAVWASPGSPYASFHGMLAGIRWAREEGRPFLGTCGGFQYSLIEYTRNVLGVADADSAENPSGSRNVVITPISCAIPSPHVPRRAGAESVRPIAGTTLADICGDRELDGEYFCSFETNADYVERWQAAGLRVAGLGPEGEMRALDLPQHPFFLATLFQPQLRSSSAEPHPIVTALLRAAARMRT
jgi:CTP synthase (UTP-ammonia lyase)